MKVIGLTGGIGSGKSTVAAILKEQFHAYLLIADDISKEFMKKGNKSYEAVVEHFGKDILQEDGEIDSKKLGQIVFHDEEALLQLNSLTHPIVLEYILATIERVKQDDRYNMIVVETALLIEAGYHDFCDEVWYVYVPEESRRKRLQASRGYSEAKMDAIFASQRSEQEFRSVADHIITNATTVDNVVAQLKDLLVR